MKSPLYRKKNGKIPPNIQYLEKTFLEKCLKGKKNVNFSQK